MTKEWDPKHSPLIAQAVRELADFDTKYPSTSDMTMVGIILLVTGLAKDSLTKVELS